MDSVGQQRMAALHGGNRDKLEVSPNLWAGIGLVRGGAGTALVGDPETVAARIQEYADLGIDTFIFSGYPHLEESIRFAELVFPLLPIETRAKLAQPNLTVHSVKSLPTTMFQTRRNKIVPSRSLHEQRYKYCFTWNEASRTASAALDFPDCSIGCLANCIEFRPFRKSYSAAPTAVVSAFGIYSLAASFGSTLKSVQDGPYSDYLLVVV